MLERLRRSLQRRERLLHVRQIQQDRAQQELAVVLNDEEALRRERAFFETAHTDTHTALLRSFDAAPSVLSDELVLYARRMETLSRFAEAKEEEIQALQPAIQERREEVLARYKARRAMEVLADHSRERVLQEFLRLEQATLDDTTTQRFHGNHRTNGRHA